MTIAIAGGGIGGLAAALALHHIGLSHVVFESVHELRPLGVGINLLPHAVQILTHLGLAGELAATGVQTADLSYYNRHGQLIWTEPRGLAAGYPVPQYSIHRGRLHRLLWQAVSQRLGPHAIRTASHLTHFTQSENKICATFEDRQTSTTTQCECDALVAADGIHSAARRRFYPDEGEPLSSGRLLWRAVSEAPPFLTGRSMIMAGHANQKFVAYPICPATAARGRSLVNWIAELHLGDGANLPPRDWNRRGDKSSFAPQFANWRFPWLDIPQLIEAAEEVYEFPMVDRDPLPQWTFGRVTLLGDAAHPMYPIGSNGASQAILDAHALAAAFAANPSPEIAFPYYEQARREHTSQIVLANRRHGPEIVMQLAEYRAPQGFENVHDVIPPAELESIAAAYKSTAGFPVPLPKS
jgi:5-methylphenazine-1-carboxylate 1-monooxygenase